MISAGTKIKVGRIRLGLWAAVAGSALLFTAAPARAVSADSLRQEVSRLASQGLLDEALDQVERNASSLPASWNAMFRGKLELDGDKAARGYKAAAADSAPPQMRGEALFRQGQYQYAAGRYHLAVPLFREYLTRYPTGVWSEASAYWMAYSCIQLVRQRPGKDGYLDTAQAYLRKLEFRGRSGYYWPLARATQARVLLMRGDTVGAQRALRDARGKAPAEEMPGVLLLSLQAGDPGDGGAWADSLRWDYPLSPETRLLGSAARARATSHARTHPARSRHDASASRREDASPQRRVFPAARGVLPGGERAEVRRGTRGEKYPGARGTHAGAERTTAPGVVWRLRERSPGRCRG